MQRKEHIIKKSISDGRDDTFNAVPRIIQRSYTSDRFCERYNYIPRAPTRNSDRCQWHYAYLSQLIDIYNIIVDTINEKYPRNKIKWLKNNAIFHNLSRLIYHCSSKYIEI
jgi:hypothetical protein